MHRNIFLAATGFFAFASAQFSSSQFPACAVTCFEQVWPASGCEITDTKCLCLNSSYRDNFKSCASKGCSNADYTTTVSQSLAICQAVGVTFTSTATAGAATAAATGQSNSNGNTGTTYSNESNKSSSTGLSQGTKIGLAAGIPCALIFFLSIGGIGLFFFRRNKQKKAGQGMAHAKPEMIQPSPPSTMNQQQPLQQQQPGMMNHQQGMMNQQPGMNNVNMQMGQTYHGQEAQWGENKEPVVEIYGQQKSGHEMPTAANRAELPDQRM